MRSHLILSLLFILPSVNAGEINNEELIQEQTQVDFEKEMLERMSKNPEFAKMAKENEEKNNPEKMNEKPEAKKIDQSSKRDFIPSKEIADEAFKKGDHETALKHYEVLGEEGDSKASLTAGIIHAKGAEGVKADKAKAAAWLKRSGEQGETAGEELYKEMEFNNELDEGVKIKVEKLTAEFNERDSKKSKQPELADPSNQLQTDSNNSKVIQYPISAKSVNPVSLVSLQVKYSAYVPERFDRGEFSYRPGKEESSHFFPARK